MNSHPIVIQVIIDTEQPRHCTRRLRKEMFIQLRATLRLISPQLPHADTFSMLPCSPHPASLSSRAPKSYTRPPVTPAPKSRLPRGPAETDYYHQRRTATTATFSTTRHRPESFTDTHTYIYTLMDDGACGIAIMLALQAGREVCVFYFFIHPPTALAGLHVGIRRENDRLFRGSMTSSTPSPPLRTKCMCGKSGGQPSRSRIFVCTLARVQGIIRFGAHAYIATLLLWGISAPNATIRSAHPVLCTRARPSSRLQAAFADAFDSATGFTAATTVVEYTRVVDAKRESREKEALLLATLIFA
ncbi:hypothetical protein C8R45DRAFT_317588 [Mycena sanguinolenta]|nr:hypothetical protein C8R45DRAFT_317588 [Mycena sanguinolenta]